MSEARETADLYPSVVEGVGNSTGNFYRTGTWTPRFSSDGATNPDADDIFTSGTYNRVYGEYTRIGDIVHAYCRLVLNASKTYQNGGANGEGISVVGFPFNVKTNSEYYPKTSPIYYDDNTTTGTIWTQYTLSGFMQQYNNKKSCKIIYTGASGNNTDYPLLTTHVNLNAIIDMFFSVTYCTDDA